MYFTDCVNLNQTWDTAQGRDFALSCKMKKHRCVAMSVTSTATTNPHIT